MRPSVKKGVIRVMNIKCRNHCGLYLCLSETGLKTGLRPFKAQAQSLIFWRCFKTKNILTCGGQSAFE